MINKNIIKSIGEKEMDRKDFLKYSGLAIVAMAGFRTVFNMLNQIDPTPKAPTIEVQREAVRGFGGGRYGV